MAYFVEIEDLKGVQHILNLDSISYVCPKKSIEQFLVFFIADEFPIEISKETYDFLRNYLIRKQFLE